MGAVQAVLLTIVPESPAYLYKAGKKEEARKVLIKLRGTTEVEDELASFAGSSGEGIYPRSNCTPWLFCRNSSTWLTRSIEAEEEPLIQATQKSVGLLEFATANKYRWSLMIVVGIMLAQQFTGRASHLVPSIFRFLSPHIFCVHSTHLAFLLLIFPLSNFTQTFFD